MLKFEEKEYDFNLLCGFTFDFQMLKEVLIKLVKSNQKLEKKMKRLEKSNNEKNKRLSTLEDRLNILFVPDENDYDDSELSEEKDEKKEEIEKIEEKKKEKEEKEEIKQAIIEEEKKEKDNEETETKQIKKHTLDRKKSLRELEFKNSFVQQVPQVSHETIKSLLKLIRENSEKISKLEKNLSKKLNKQLKDLEDDFVNFNEENTKEHESLKQRIKEINEKLYDYNDKMDGIIVKTAPLDTLSFFRDNGSGNLDANKGMIKLLEQKINKRIELIEKKSNKDNKEDNTLKNKITELEELINKINEEMKKQEQKKNNNLENIINNYNEDIQELKDLIDKNYNELIKITEELSSKMENGEIIGDKVNELLIKIKSEKEFKISKYEPVNKSNNISEEAEENIREKQEDTDIGDNISDIKERVKALNNKINDIDKYFKSLFDNSNQDIVEIKKKMEEMSSILDQKITKLDLKALENKAIEQSDEILFLQDKTTELTEGIKKLMENNSSVVKRLENLTNDVIRLDNKEVKVVESQPIDLSGFVEENTLNEMLNPINKSLEKLFLEKELLIKSIKETNDNFAIYETKERVMKLEEEMLEKIGDLENVKIKKYVEKNEMNKIIKNLELKLKLLDTQQNKDGDSWILAKQPFGCFNCASCEANIKNVSPSNEYSIWNKYPQPDRQYHMGQGFSRLLKKINNYNDKNKHDKKDLSNDTELGSSIYMNNMPNIRGINGHFLFRSNSKEPIKDKIIENNFRYNKKYKLPNVTHKRKIIENIPLTDEEDERNNKSMDNTNNSPQIMKIAKKKINGDLLSFKIHHKKFQEENNILMNSTSVKSIGKLERNQSLPFYENKTNE